MRTPKKCQVLFEGAKVLSKNTPSKGLDFVFPLIQNMCMDDKYIVKAREIILHYIDREDISVFLFGSRTKSPRISSDLDIGFLGSTRVSRKTLSRIRFDLEESDIPYHVDLVDFNTVSESFKKTALEDIKVWNQGKYF